MELVTIIIPYFKKKKFIKTIFSALNQTYPNIEIIIVMMMKIKQILYI